MKSNGIMNELKEVIKKIENNLSKWINKWDEMKQPSRPAIKLG